MAAAALLFFPAWSAAQSGYTISTIAGTPGSPGFSGDSGAATSAQLAGPISLAIDSSGNLYIADENNQRIRKIAGGNISTYAGNGARGYLGDGAAATSAQLSVPNAVALDKSGNLYIVDSGNFVVRKVTSDGKIATVAGNNLSSIQTNGGFTGDGGLATNAALAFSSGVAVDGAGNIFIADTNNNRIRKVDAGTGNISTVVNTNGALG